MKTANKQRLFFALWPDDGVRKGLIRLQESHVPAQASPHHPADLHMTLHFLGLIEPHRIEDLSALLDKVDAPAFDLTLRHLECWSRPKVLWCGPDEIPEQLTLLHQETGFALKRAGFAIEERAYRPHVTLARKVFHFAPSDLDEGIDWRVRRLALVVSETVPKSPRYRLLQSCLLKN